MRRFAFAIALVLTCAPALAGTLTVNKIMANPDWIGPAVESPYWSANGRFIYYRLKRDGSQIRDLYRADPATGKSVKLDGRAQANADGRSVFNNQHTRAAFIRHGDVFVREIATGRLLQVTATPQTERGVQWSSDGDAVQFRIGNTWYRHALASGTTRTVAVLKSADNPQDAQPGQLERHQLRLFSVLRHARAEKDAERTHQKQLDASDTTRDATPFWLGKKVTIVDSELSPNGRWMLVVTQPRDHASGRAPVVNHYVTDSGYIHPEKARTYVGRNPPAPQSLVLLDLSTHKQFSLSLDALPAIHDDPLASLRASRQAQLRKDGHDAEARALDAPQTRGVRIADGGPATMSWSDDGTQAAVMLRAIDNKDRWIASIDFPQHRLVPQDRLHDPAWINWNYNSFGFLPHSHTLWFESEKTGYAQLYVKPLDGHAKQLTSGHFEVRLPQVSPDGKWFYVVANKQAPGAYDVYRVRASGGALERVTAYQGLYDFEEPTPFHLSPDGSRLAVLHSSAYVPPQLAVINVDGSGGRELTDTRTAQYKAMHWVQPQIVKVPSSHGHFEIYAKLYKAADFDASKPHPAVLFVHGAGYLQDVTDSWSYYFREQMFNNLLTQEGYVVLDMDYRGSEGYGRDWRTAIYQHMGHPELEDLLDGKTWLVEHDHVDPKRVGIYGGSYGGFMTEMALLRAPGQFAAGAALRPPADWMTYNDEYTSNILNDPQLDPQAYKVSSPIEYAANLKDPLLICHGLIDNNVMPTDSIRLYQRFIELHKDHFWLSLYPTERHGFVHADDWRDEYTRIHALFTRYVKPAHVDSRNP
ncbi:prolyl oligopeptidase family serine peptidase [Oleiagrimonas sp.]|jgi:dipeptidyl aminopeptidase/acylaminoacyl peptidase|uniref:S9 family peptidase n=1 Tax=Oleiagrimonas sp. TaxID=2010330 RepID=UPI002603DD6F|nr:prolyl oligopeptidase family serine peptidase [Oleiagrimonas sp.]MDA3914313.1 prolyl oligopeptidase family serine peptidase [Oleiagrimonas sp.]